MSVVRKLEKNNHANLSVDGESIELPVIEGTEGERAIDISKLRAETGLVTIDNGYVNTGSCTSEITFLDGEQGILRYRGYPIEQLAEKSSFVEVSYLLIHGSLPKANELARFEEKVASFGEVKDGVKNLIKSFPRDAHPMGVLAAATASLSAYYPHLLDQDLNDAQKEDVIALLMAQTKNISAMFYRHSQGKDLIDSNSGLDYCSDWLNMMYGESPDQDIVDALNTLLILHADHEQNCSTSTVRLVGSSKANLFASISAGISALWGPWHGGANQAVIEMLEEIQAAGGDSKKALSRAKDKADTFKLMGFGHRVYRNFDPRALIIKESCDKVLAKLGVSDPLLNIAKSLEQEALNDPYFKDRKLYPNVDFYSGIIYKALEIPTNMFTVMFALGRLPGWMAQWKEMIESPALKIGRPRQIYVGQTKRDYVPMKERT